MSCRHAKLTALVSGALLFAACVADEAPTLPGLQRQSAATCDSFASRCPLTVAEQQDCRSMAVCTANLVRPEIADAVFACRAAAACDALDSELCFVPEVAGFVASARWATYEPACLARLDVCAAEGAPYINDFCQKPYSAASDDVLDAMQACLDGPCTVVTDCVVALTADLCVAP